MSRQRWGMLKQSGVTLCTRRGEGVRAQSSVAGAAGEGALGCQSDAWHRHPEPQGQPPCSRGGLMDKWSEARSPGSHLPTLCTTLQDPQTRNEVWSCRVRT